MTDLRALDARIAERVMGLHVEWLAKDDEPLYAQGRDYVEPGEPYIVEPGQALPRVMPYYSASIMHAWRVVRRMRQLGWQLFLAGPPVTTGEIDIAFQQWVRDEYGAVELRKWGAVMVPAGEEPRGICEAALAALGDS